jgi:cyclic pyranopterin phosphate synthase
LQEGSRNNCSAPSAHRKFLGRKGELCVIASVSELFRASCARARLNADAKLLTCLFSDRGHDLKSLIRSDATDDQVIEVISSVWSKRTEPLLRRRIEPHAD